jgi:exodeoxyribonuclease-5
MATKPLTDIEAALSGVKGPKKPPKPKKKTEPQVNPQLTEPATLESLGDFTLSDDQKKAWKSIKRWVTLSKDPYYELKGYAGTGKTHLLKMMRTLKANIYYTAPTNKAAKVIERALDCPAKTTFSLLGIRMDGESETLKLKMPDKLPDLGLFPIIVVDETSMVSEQLCKVLEDCVVSLDARIFFVGDPAQLPPVQEETSAAWGLALEQNRSFLREVMRFDNQLLSLATRIRKCISAQEFKYGLLQDDHDKSGGVRLLVGPKEFQESFLRVGDSPEFYDDRKVIAWRNVVVNEYNAKIRKRLGFKVDYEAGDRLLLSSPLKVNGMIMDTIDTELIVVSAEESYKTITYTIPRGSQERKKEFPVWVLNCLTSDNVTRVLTAPKNQPHAAAFFSGMASEIGRIGSKFDRSEGWKVFWNLKEIFHSVRYNYAITAHRAQGSTYKTVFIDSRDILSNPDKFEALRCLYVAATRPSKFLVAY